MIADVAAVFHWPKAEIEAMTLDELMRWRERAIKRWNAMQGQE
ncbi:GpE family phage tail protein [Novosphingobium humi]